MAQATIEHRLSTVERRTDKVEAEVRDLDTHYGEITYRMDRRLSRIEITIDRIADVMGVTPATDEDVDAAFEERA